MNETSAARNGHGKRGGPGGRSAPGQMRRLGVFAAAFVLVASGCGVAGQGANERTALVDFSHDEFASFMIANFPKEIEASPGMTLVFKQTWTGEPHTVTGGTLVNDMMGKAGNLIQFFTAYEGLVAKGVELPNPEAEELPQDAITDVLRRVEESKVEPERTEFLEAWDALIQEGVKLPPRNDPGDATFADVGQEIDRLGEEVFENSPLPWAADESEEGAFVVTQNAGQPCFLGEGAPPKDADEACAEEDQRQPAFDGKASYYNSGIIPYEGPQGNTFRVELADDIDPGSYFFYCAVHGPSQVTEVKVQPEDADVESQEAVSRRARQEIAKFADPMLKSFRDAADGEIEVQGETVEGPFAGVSSPAHGSINEFVPRTINAKVGEEVTWKLMGSDHTVTFDVPEYFPIIQFAEDGKVSLNPRLHPPAGGSPKIPEQEGEGILRVDGGTYDGSGFFSSGLFGAEPYAEYSLRFSKPGSYKYACLLHPPMVGTVEVT